MPAGIPRGLDRRSWASLYAEEWWSRTISPPGRHQIKALVRTLADVHAYAHSHLPMHRGFLHLPSLNLTPQLVSFGFWEAAGDRAGQLRSLTRADDPAFTQPPAVEEFGTGNLGPGLKVLGHSRDDDAVTGHLAYAWRSEELATALRMFTGSPDLGRLHRALPDIEDLARAVARAPLEPGDGHSAP